MSSGDERVFYRDHKPYDVPERLESLQGPEHGLYELPINIYWGPNPLVDLDTPEGVEKAYQSVIEEGRTEDQIKLLNASTLVSVWHSLLLPARARAAGEARFPQLASV